MELLLGLPSVSLLANMLADMLLADMLLADMLADMLGHQFEMRSEKRIKQEKISYK